MAKAAERVDARVPLRKGACLALELCLRNTLSVVRCDAAANAPWNRGVHYPSGHRSVQRRLRRVRVSARLAAQHARHVPWSSKRPSLRRWHSRQARARWCGQRQCTAQGTSMRGTHRQTGTQHRKTLPRAQRVKKQRRRGGHRHPPGAGAHVSASARPRRHALATPAAHIEHDTCPERSRRAMRRSAARRPSPDKRRYSLRRGPRSLFCAASAARLCSGRRLARAFRSLPPRWRRWVPCPPACVPLAGGALTRPAPPARRSMAARRVPARAQALAPQMAPERPPRRHNPIASDARRLRPARRSCLRRWRATWTARLAPATTRRRCVRAQPCSACATHAASL